MESYSVADVERFLGLTRSTVRGLVAIGSVKPTRGARREYRFSFQDLIVLRAAKSLIDAKVAKRRIRRALEELRAHLPEEMPLSGLSITAIGDQVVVRDGTTHWQADNGQYLLGFGVEMDNGVLKVVEPVAKAEVIATTSEPVTERELDEADWFARALELEGDDPRAARVAYERAVASDPENAAAWVNWGRLLHEQGGTKEAEKVYRQGLDHCGSDPLLMFNLAVLLEDVGRTGAAIEAYHNAIGEDPSLADCHYNLARLYESMGQQQHAIRHLGQYRRLVTVR